MRRSVRFWLAVLALGLLAGCLAGASAAAASSKAVGPAAAPTKVVRFHDYRVVVPSSWPVFDLGRNPAACVRFNRHAIYLGQPGANQQCPAHAVGRTEAILVQPLVAAAARGGAPLGPTLPSTIGAAEARGGSAATLTLPRAGVTVTATWHTQPTVVRRALGVGSLATLRASTTAAAPSNARLGGPEAHAASVYTGLGFDPCAAPSFSAMSAWRASPYRAIGIYIGGTNMACSQPNLTASWLSTEAAAGWHFIPTYVGLQAPSNGCGCAAIKPGQAAGEGTSAANDAVSQASAHGIRPGNPIYFDMEAYSRGGSETPAVLSFLAAWTNRLHALGYKSGVYANGTSGVRDLAAGYGSGYPEPDDLWVADWNGQRTTSDPYVPAGDWSSHRRLHQYNGGHDERYGGVTINIDNDYLDGATAGTSVPIVPDGTFVEVVGTSSVYRIAGGAPLFVNSWNDFGGSQPVTMLKPQQFAQLNPVPKGGTFLETTNGDYYRVAGGAPLFVDNPARFGSLRPIVVDQWDIDNAGNPASHLYPVPRKGTFLVTTTGRKFRVAGGAPFAIASWSVFGGRQPAVTIDEWDIDNITNPLAHLGATPSDGTLVEGVPSHSYWAFTGGQATLINPTPAATVVADAGLVQLGVKIPSCVVPYLGHKTLAQARSKLRAAHCRLGRVRRLAFAATHSSLHVIKQSPRSRSRHGFGYQVAVTLG